MGTFVPQWTQCVYVCECVLHGPGGGRKRDTDIEAKRESERQTRGRGAGSSSDTCGLSLSLSRARSRSMSFYFISLSLGLTQDRWVFGGGRGSTVVAFRLDRSKAKRDILWFCLFVKYGPCEGTCLRCLFFYATPSPVLLSSIKFHHSPFLLLCSNRCLPLSRELEGAEIGGGEEWRAGRKRREWSLLFGCFWEDLHLNSHSSQWSWPGVSLLVCWCVLCAKQQKTLFSSSATETLPQSRLCFFSFSLSRCSFRCISWLWGFRLIWLRKKSDRTGRNVQFPCVEWCLRCK